MRLSGKEPSISAWQLLSVLFRFLPVESLERASAEDFFSFVPGHTWLCHHVFPT
jgi:hypothetical protein